jgi:hypothetical protein
MMTAKPTFIFRSKDDPGPAIHWLARQSSYKRQFSGSFGGESSGIWDRADRYERRSYACS